MNQAGQDFRRIMFSTHFDAAELFSLVPGEKARAFLDIARDLGAKVVPTFKTLRNVRDEFMEAARSALHGTVLLEFGGDIDYDTARTIIARFAREGLIETGAMHVDLSHVYKDAPDFNI